ncbi:MAG: N-acetyltransferase family protein [Blastocatellales bacterium]
MNAKAEVIIRRAGAKDADAFLSLLAGLAEYEGYEPPGEMERTRLLEDAFGERPRFSVFLAEVEGQAAGYALVFETYSSFWARPKLYLEDLFVKPEFRGHGVGQALFKFCASVAVERGCVRMQWIVLDWNTPAMKFYEGCGAYHLKDWRTYNLDEEQLRGLSGTAAESD